YKPAAGTLFGAAGPSFIDVEQGSLGDCWYMADLEEVAFKSPSLIRDMFIDNGDYTYTVRFFRNGSDTPDYVTVDRFLPVRDDSDLATPTWGHNRFIFGNQGDLYSDSNNKIWVAL